jgi:hypothetical protein
MVYIWLFMKLYSYSMSCIFPYDRISLRFDIFRYLISDITEVITRAYLLDPDLPCALGHSDELFGFWVDFADCVHPTRISEVSTDHTRDVDIEDISFFEDFFCARDAMTDNIVDRYTGTARISSLPPLIVPEIVYTC